MGVAEGAMGAGEGQGVGMGEEAVPTEGEGAGCMGAGMMGMLITPTLERGAAEGVGAEVVADEELHTLSNNHVESMEQISI